MGLGGLIPRHIGGGMSKQRKRPNLPREIVTLYGRTAEMLGRQNNEERIRTLAKVVASVFEYLCTPEGQAQAKEWREDRAKMRADWEAITLWFAGLTRR
jgi:hypothetical protein